MGVHECASVHEREGERGQQEREKIYTRGLRAGGRTFFHSSRTCFISMRIPGLAQCVLGLVHGKRPASLLVENGSSILGSVKAISRKPPCPRPHHHQKIPRLSPNAFSCTHSHTLPQESSKSTDNAQAAANSAASTGI